MRKVCVGPRFDRGDRFIGDLDLFLRVDLFRLDEGEAEEKKRHLGEHHLDRTDSRPKSTVLFIRYLGDNGSQRSSLLCVIVVFCYNSAVCA